MQKPMWSHLRVQIKLALLPLSAELYKIKNLNSKHVWVWTQRPGRRVCKWWLNDFCSVYKNSSEFSNEAMSNTFSRNAGQNNTEMCLKQLSAHTSHTSHTQPHEILEDSHMEIPHIKMTDSHSPDLFRTFRSKMIVHLRVDCVHALLNYRQDILVWQRLFNGPSLATWQVTW